ncbi:hypothetical protein P170DRAFT_265135 [Aspergillus steynii IBT 23096]|uniref:Uncharacterized protein n=1 Tax=Aspergillus steynii IBT 23096 TaxID=1392250 RepID=A0A2I2FVP4_9EURO|nr:uncharacterized protein P170DRAFT_265135 [Aspergillus steynii IBT 23096]PLB44702.1 hypothetical protein P170DRAFT_265135 [Aspergillus steynii IBT 23096]
MYNQPMCLTRKKGRQSILLPPHLPPSFLCGGCLSFGWLSVIDCCQRMILYNSIHSQNAFVGCAVGLVIVKDV